MLKPTSPNSLTNGTLSNEEIEEIAVDEEESKMLTESERNLRPENAMDQGENKTPSTMVSDAIQNDALPE